MGIAVILALLLQAATPLDGPRLVWRVDLPATARSMVSLWDVDGGGLPDLAIGQPHWRSLGGRGRVVVLSSETGEMLDLVTTEQRRLDFGAALAFQPGAEPRLGASFQSGPTERAELGLVVWAPAADGSGALEERDVLSAPGMRSTVARRWREQQLVALGDVDGDGLGDWLLGLPDHPVPGARWASGRLLAFAATGELIWQRMAREGQLALGAALTVLPDADGDGFADVLVGCPGTGSESTMLGSLHLLSGADGHELERTLGERGGVALGRGLATRGHGALAVGGPLRGRGSVVWRWRRGQASTGVARFPAGDPRDDVRLWTGKDLLLVSGVDGERASVWARHAGALDSEEPLGPPDLPQVARLFADGQGLGPMLAVPRGPALRLIVTRYERGEGTVVAAWDMLPPRAPGAPRAAEPRVGGLSGLGLSLDTDVFEAFDVGSDAAVELPPPEVEPGGILPFDQSPEPVEAPAEQPAEPADETPADPALARPSPAA